MSSFDINDIKKVARLARLDISEAELPSYAVNLNKILHLVEHIQQANTENIAPMAHPFAHLQQPLRADEVSEPNLRERFQELAPLTEAGLYLVPKVI